MNELITFDEACALIQGGASLCLAGSAESLARLPGGKWIGGSIPYFMTAGGGVKSTDKLFVTRFPDFCQITTALYGAAEVEKIVPNTPENGFSFAITPCGSPALERFSLIGHEVEDAFLKPVVGWVSGVELERIGQDKPCVYLGSDPKPLHDGIVVAHVALPEGRLASLSITNIFQGDSGDVIRFSSLSTSVTECTVNGVTRAMADYLRERGDAEGVLPLVGDFAGAAINVSIQGIDSETGRVSFYAPVFPDTDYHMARPVADYAKAFAEQLEGEEGEASAFSCNCILNYVFGQLEGRKTGGIVGPITFGEIAYQLLNQTMVRLHIH